MMSGDDENQDEEQVVGDDENLVDSEQEDDSTHRLVCQKVSRILSGISIEPSLFLLMFGYGLYNVIAQVCIDSNYT